MSDHSYRILSPSPTSFKKSPTISLLREHDRKNATFDWLVGLCAGSGAKTRIERMQEKRIFKILSSSPEQTYHTFAPSINSMVISYDEVGVEGNPFVDRVRRPESPDTNWADEVGGNITGIRDAKASFLKPWKEPNFGITFRYRLKEDELVDNRQEPQLPGNRSLYGGQWFREERQPKKLYPIPPQSPICSDCTNSSDGALEMRRDRACKDWVFSGGYRRSRKGKDGVVNEARLEGLRVPSEPAKITNNTFPSFATANEHIHCFPPIAWPQRPRAKLNLERSCAQYKEIDQDLERMNKIYEEYHQVLMAQTDKEVTNAGNSTAPVLAGNKTEVGTGPIEKWKIRRLEVEAEATEKRQNYYRTSASSRSESQPCTTSQMPSEQEQKKIAGQEKKIQKQMAAERECEMRMEQKKLAAARQQAQHRVKAFKPDPKTSIIAQRATKPKVGGRVVFARPREMARLRGPIAKNEAVLAAERKVKEDGMASTVEIEKVVATMGEFKAKTEEKVAVAVDQVKAEVEKEVASTMNELKEKAEKVEEEVTTTIDDLKNALQIVRPSTGEASAEKATESCKEALKDVSQVTDQAVEKEAIDAAIEYCNNLNARVSDKNHGDDCAIDSDSEEEWDPKWIVERPRRYSMEHRNSHLH